MASRKAFTFVEALVAMTVSGVVLYAAWSLFFSTTTTTRRSMDIASASQAAAQLLHELELDFANVVPQPLRDGTVAIDEATPGVKRLGILRANTTRELQVSFDAPDVMPARPAVQIWYAAVKNANDEPYEIMRYGDGTLTRFAGVYAKDVTFRFVPEAPASADAPVPDQRENFVRVALLLTATPTTDPAPGIVMTGLYHVPRPPAPLDQ